MAITNKWKEASLSDSSLSNTDLDDIENQVQLEEDAFNRSVRSDWTMQRKMGVAMGIVGAILVVVGLAPMFLDSDNLKGSLSEQQQESDPLTALFSGSGNSSTSSSSEDTQNTENTQNVTDPSSDSQHFEPAIPSGTTGFGISSGGDDSVAIEDNSPQTVDVTLPENSTNDAQIVANNVGVTVGDTSIESEVDNIIDGGDTVSVTNSNTGVTDTLGAEFMTENPNISSMTSELGENFHGSAGLQNTSVSIQTNKLSSSGPADMALIVFLLSLFVVGGVRYRKELF